MHIKKVKVRCLSSQGKLYLFPIKIDKIYDAELHYTEDIEEDGIVFITNELGERDFYSVKRYFEIL